MPVIARRLPTGKLTAYLVLVVGLALTAWAWWSSRAEALAQIEQRFELRTQELANDILARMRAYRQVLRGGVGLFIASGHVSRAEWRSYVERLRLADDYPGIQGMGFARYVGAEERDELVAQVRAEGFPEFDIRPGGIREHYGVIVYLEPFDWRNQRAFGYDMFSEPVRRAAMVEARDGGRTSVSGKVTLMQETEQDVQAGFLMYVPLYRGGEAPDTVEARRENLLGWVYSPFRMKDLMHGILGREVPDIALAVYDGHVVSEDTLMYASPSAPERSHFVKTVTLDVLGHPWTVRMSSQPGLMDDADFAQPFWLLLGGSAISLMLFTVMYSLATTQARAKRLAEAMTAAWQETEVRYGALIRNSFDAIVIADEEQRVHSWNPAFEDMFGYRPEAILGRPLTELIPALADPGAAAGSGRIHRVSARRSSGESFPVELALSQWQAGGRTYHSAIVRDITVIREAEESLKRANAELEVRVEQRTHQLRQQAEELSRSNRELEQFAYVASHDLQEPLRSVASFAQLLERRYGDRLDEEGLSFVRFIAAGASRMRQLVADLLAYSRVGAQEKPPEPVAMDAALADALSNLSAIIAARGAEVTHDPLPVVTGDRLHMVQLLQNLIGNAIKFNESVPPRVHVGVVEREDAWEFSVADNGIGIPGAALERIFGIFQRGGSGAYEGSGMGLAITKKLVERYGGRIWVSSSAGAGSTFFFTLPRAR